MINVVEYVSNAANEDELIEVLIALAFTNEEDCQKQPRQERRESHHVLHHHLNTLDDQHDQMEGSDVIFFKDVITISQIEILERMIMMRIWKFCYPRKLKRIRK